MAAGRLERREGVTNMLVDHIARLERRDLPAAKVSHIEPRRAWSRAEPRDPGEEADLRAVAPAGHSLRAARALGSLAMRRLTLLLALLVLLGSVPAAASALPREYSIPGAAVFPEGVTLRPGTDQFFVSSTTDGTIFRGRLGRAAMRPFLEPGAHGRSNAVGLRATRNPSRRGRRGHKPRVRLRPPQRAARSPLLDRRRMGS